MQATYLKDQAYCRELLFSFNKLQTVPDMDKLMNLRAVDLSYNYIRRITCQDFKSLLFIESIDLSHNLISLIDQTAFQFNSMLSSLILSDNQLTSMKSIGFVHKLLRIEYLDISSNSITHMSVLGFIYLLREPLKRLKKLHLRQKCPSASKRQSYDLNQQLSKIKIYFPSIDRIDDCIMKETACFQEYFRPSLRPAAEKKLKPAVYKHVTVEDVEFLAKAVIHKHSLNPSIYRLSNFLIEFEQLKSKKTIRIKHLR